MKCRKCGRWMSILKMIQKPTAVTYIWLCECGFKTTTKEER